MRLLGQLLLSAAALATLLVGGCTFFPDFEHTPSARLPVSEVVNQIRCDMYEFLSSRGPGSGTFSLDTRSYATVELTLNTTAFGDVRFARVDALKLNASNWLAVGNPAAGLAAEPFPSVGGRNSNQVTTRVQVNISQNPNDLRAYCEGGPSYGRNEIFSDKPHADRKLINDLRVASWLKRTFESADRIATDGPNCNAYSKTLPGGGGKRCSVGLQTATLTSRFQVVADVSGGILSLRKIIPVVQSPVLSFGVDYSHQLQIIFQGNDIIDTKVAGAGRMVGKAPRAAAPTVCNNPPPELKADCDRIRELERQLGSSSDDRSSADQAAIAQQLRAIRDALILSGPR